MFKIKLRLFFFAAIVFCVLLAAISFNLLSGSDIYFFNKNREKIRLFFTFNRAEKTELRLTYAAALLDGASVIKDKDGENIIARLMEEYGAYISSALEDADKIKDLLEKREALILIFQKTAAHQAILQALYNRPPNKSLVAVSKARDVNIKIQELAVGRLLELIDEREIIPSDQTSNTSKILFCKECNIIVISLTTLRKDHMGIYGYEKKTTPNIDEFFKNSLRFTNTTAPSSWTAPDAVSLFTALFPYRHGIMKRDSFSLYNRKVLTLAEILKKNGYITAAFTGGGDYNNRYTGLNRGFDFYLDENNFHEFGLTGNLTLGSATLSYAPIKSFSEISADWLKNNSGSKFFLFLQGYDTHCPLEPREPFARQFTAGLRSNIDFSVCHWTYGETKPLYENGEKYWIVKTSLTGNEGVKFFQGDLDYMIALYDARIAEMDFYLESVFQKIKELGLGNNTIIILMSDHGEMLGEHGRFMRGGTLRGSFYEAALSFPLLINHPKIRETIVVDDPVQTVDLMPTIFDMLGLKDPQSSIRDGRTLQFSAFKDIPTNEYAYAGSLYLPVIFRQFFNKPTELNMIKDNDWKLIKETFFSESGFEATSASYKLFNLKEDPNEEINLYGTEVNVANRLKREMELWRGSFR